MLTPSAKISLLIGLVAFLTYCRGLFNGFVFDDFTQVLGNHWITSPLYLPDIFSSDIAGFMGEKFHYYRPLVMACHMLCFSLFGHQAWGFHLVSIMLHVANSLLVLALISRLSASEQPALPCKTSYLPAGAALLFAVHPIHAEPVLYVSAVGDLLCTLFALIALLLHLRWSESGKSACPWGSGGAFCCALLCKETALVVPLVLMAHDLQARGRGRAGGPWWRSWFPCLAVAVMYLWLRHEILGGVAPDPAFAGHPAGAIRLFALYMAKLALPLRLNEYYSATWISPQAPVTAGYPVFLLAILSLWILLYRKQRKVALFGLMIMVLPLLPAIYVSGYSWSGFAERYLYLPSVGFVLVVGDLMGALPPIPAKQRGHLLKAALGGLIAMGMASNIRMGHVWKDECAIWADTVRKSPRNPEARIGYARSLEEMGREEEAARQYETANSIAEAGPLDFMTGP